MRFSRREIGLLLIGLGAGLIVLSTPLNFFSVVDIKLFGAEVAVEGISPYSASALGGGVILILLGIYLLRR